MPAECSYHHSAVWFEVFTIVFYFRVELFSAAGSFSYILLPVFFSSEDVFHTFSQNEIVFGS